MRGALGCDAVCQKCRRIHLEKCSPRHILIIYFQWNHASCIAPVFCLIIKWLLSLMNDIIPPYHVKGFISWRCPVFAFQFCPFVFVISCCRGFALYREMLGKHRKQCIHWSCSLTVIDSSPVCGPMWNPLICHLLFGFYPNSLQIPPTHI